MVDLPRARRVTMVQEAREENEDHQDSQDSQEFSHPEVMSIHSIVPETCRLGTYGYFV